jgi:hypothetical protein
MYASLYKLTVLTYMFLVLVHNTYGVTLSGSCEIFSRVFGPWCVAGFGIWMTAMSLIGKCFVSMCYATVHLFSAELLPTEVRSAGLGFASVCARVSGMAAPFITGPLVLSLFVT